MIPERASPLLTQTQTCLFKMLVPPLCAPRAAMGLDFSALGILGCAPGVRRGPLQRLLPRGHLRRWHLRLLPRGHLRLRPRGH